MIELSVSLASNGTAKLPGYEQLVRFGYTKNRGVYRLHVDATGEWEGLTIRCFWHVPDGKDPSSSLVVDGYVDVPASVTAQPGSGCITFEGSDGTKTVTSADLRYRVSANSGTEDGTEPEPGTPAWQQLVDAVHTDATAAEQAKTDAQTAAQQAGASAKKAGQALSDTISAKEDALKAIGDKQTTATQAVDIARDKALQQVEASTEAAQTAASEATTSAGDADRSAQEAAGSLQELKDGIANGNFKGEPGNDGKSPVVTVTDIENGYRVSITDKDGTKTIDVLNGKDGKDGTQIDDATVGLDAWSSKHIVDMLCPPLDETGNPVTCYPVAGYPLGCKVSWEPTQEGTGDPSPENVRPIKGRDSVTVTRCGENLLNPSLFQNNKYQNFNVATNYYEISNSSCYWISGIQPCSPNTTYRFNKNVEGGCFYDEKKNVIGIVGFELTFKTPAKCAYYCVNFSSGSTPYGTPVIATASKSTAPTTYTPYTGQTATITLPHTIYGGTVDAVTGEGQETWKLLTLDGTESWNTWGLNANNPAVTGFYTYDINNYAIINAKVICSNLAAPNQDVWGGRNAGIGLATSGSSLYFIYSVPTSLLTDISAGNEVASLKAYLAAQYAAGTPVQIAYKLATPTPFTATGARPIPALSGVNTVLTDANSVVVTGRADPIKRIIDLEDAVASMTNT